MFLNALPWTFDVGPAVEQIEEHPELWNQYSVRRYGPHSTISDIWVRYNAWENFKDRESFNGPHESVWYPAGKILTEVRELVFELMYRVQAERLGGVLITKVPAHDSVKPHIDQGWHATYYEKFAIQLASAPGQAFQFENESLAAKPGESYTFDNSQVHWVTNESDEDRMTLICCLRRS